MKVDSFFRKTSAAVISQKTADSLIMNYIINDMRPVATVESIHFRALVTGLNPTVTVMCRKTAAVHVQQYYEKMMYKEFNEVSFICTTFGVRYTEASWG